MLGSQPFAAVGIDLGHQNGRSSRMAGWMCDLRDGADERGKRFDFFTQCFDIHWFLH